MARTLTGRSESELMTLLKPVLLEDEQVAVMADGTFSPIDYHDSLTMFFLRLTGKWKAVSFVIAVTDKRLRWLELGENGTVTVHRDYRLPLKGRLVMQQPGVIELLLPGEPRRFLQFSEKAKAGVLYSKIDDQQGESKRGHDETPEVVGSGVKPALVGQTFTPGEHGQSTIVQHEMTEEIRPSYSTLVKG